MLAMPFLKYIGMESCHVRDAAALCRYFAWLEKEAAKGTQTEISGADQLQKYREWVSEKQERKKF